ncbi:acyltransferase [Winogradskyella maritima]|uniref:Acyltransferase family protein n=1 Tax=Winogradskyella maritima TaxID=1517766 RepID=A0ABV8AJI8_9FLAO|nr:acyltransferase [Winogradskyella maritima]
MTTLTQRNFGLDVIRAIAILLVLLSHCTYLLPNQDGLIIEGIRLMGAIGVDLFFILSGFLIGGILLRKFENNQISMKHLVHFWKRRWLRTLPNYVVIFILNILVFYWFEGYIMPKAPSYALFLQNFAWPHPDFFTEAWSLSIEEYAYLLLPLLLFGASKLFKKTDKSKTFLNLTILSIVLLFGLKVLYYLNASVEDYKTWSATFRKVVIYRLDAIYFGFLLVYLYSRLNWFTTQKRLLFLVGLSSFMGIHALIFGFNLLPNTHLAFYVFVYLTVVVLSLGLCFPYCMSLSGYGILKKIVTYISIRSYALYLVNYSLVLLSLQRYVENSWGVIIIFLVLSFVLSEILYRSIERPFLKIRKTLVPRLS